ncbi:MAG: transporter substrate-binding domain-containing protein [Succinivibrio sp.]|nr:transporter substrate-binding domain-containing protein [Succinivibrio sp.]
MKLLTLTLGLVLTLVTALTAAMADDNKGEELAVLTEAAFPPFEFYDENRNLTGFDVDLMKEIGKVLGRSVRFEEIPFAQIMDGVESGRCKLAISAITITAERLKKVNFSDSYIKAGLSLAVNSLYAEYLNEKNLDGKPICVEAGTVSETMARRYQHSKILSFSSSDEACEAFNNQECQVLINERLVNQYNIKIGKLEDAVLYPVALTAQQLGIAVNKQHPELLDAVNEALAQLKNSGVYDEIFNKWFEIDVRR